LLWDHHLGAEKWDAALAVPLQAAVSETLNLKPDENSSIGIIGGRAFVVEYEGSRLRWYKS
jgi:hypothetical protein